MFEILKSENRVLKVRINDFNPFHTFLCGQCFRWNQDDEGFWKGIVSGRCIKLHWDGEICTFFDMDQQEFLQQWVHYFDLDTDYTAIKKLLSEKDEHLQQAVLFGHGIHLLRQELWEVLLSFLISQNNGIPRIKQIIETLSFHFGQPLPGDCKRQGFPEPGILADTGLDNINICRGGYRCKYILSTAKRLQESPEILISLKHLPKDKARELLLSFSGIGEKVADCVLLYSGIDRSAFPIDRWVKRVMETLYFKKETDEKTIREFSREYFGDLSGIAQQYLFYYARENKLGMNSFS